MGQLSPTETMSAMDSNVTNGFGTITRNGNTYTYTSGSKSSTPGQSTSWTMPSGYSNPKYPDKSAPQQQTQQQTQQQQQQPQQPAQQQQTYSYNGQTYYSKGEAENAIYSDTINKAKQNNWSWFYTAVGDGTKKYYYMNSSGGWDQASNQSEAQQLGEENYTKNWLSTNADKSKTYSTKKSDGSTVYSAYTNGSWTPYSSQNDATIAKGEEWLKTNANQGNVSFINDANNNKIYYAYVNGKWTKADSETAAKKMKDDYNTSSKISFISGLTQTQKDSITNLVNSRPSTDWSPTDIKNWNYATNKSTFPSGQPKVLSSTQQQTTAPTTQQTTQQQTIPQQQTTQQPVQQQTQQQTATTGQQIPFSGTLTEGKVYTDNQGRYYQYKGGQWQKIDQATYNTGAQKGIIAAQEGNWIESQMTGQHVNEQTQSPKNITEMTPEEAANSNYQFSGNYALVNFTDDNSNVIYLYDKQNKTYRPFQSTDAIAKYYGIPSSDVTSSINSLPSTIMQTTNWTGSVLDNTYLVKDDGTASKEPAVTAQQTSPTSTIYGQPKQDAQTEQWVSSLLNSTMSVIKNKGLISPETFSATMGNPSQLAKYINAVLYGGYTLGDIFRDMKIKQLATQGNSTYSGAKAFDETVPASQWYSTEEAQKVKNDSNLTPPLDTLNFDSSLFNNPIFQIPDQAFSALVKPIDWTSPEFKAEAEKIQAAWYDISMQVSEADTEQKKAVALGNWEKLKTDLEKKYGIQLSNNAKAAWGQLQDMFSGYSGRGIQQSGLFNEVMDNYLSDVRDNDQLLREGKIDEKDAEYRNYLLQNGTPEEIQAFISANPDKAKAWGIVPSDEKKQWFSLENLKSVYPDMDDGEIQRVHDMVLDQNGNYRSELYQSLYTNKYNLSEQKKTYQQQKLAEQKLAEEQKDYAPFTKTSGLSSYVPPGSSYLDVTKGLTPQTSLSSTAPSTTSPTQTTAPQNTIQPIVPTTSIGNQPVSSVKIPSTSPSVTAPSSFAPTASTYTVKAGDTLSKIAGTLGVTIGDLQKANVDKIKDINKIYTGDTFQIPTKPNATTASPSSATPSSSNSLSTAASVAGQLGTNSGLKVVSNHNPKNYSGPSIVDYLKSIGYGSDLATRQKLAKDYGMTSYDYVSGLGNTELLKKMRGY